MRVYYDCDEWFPVYTLYENKESTDESINITPELLEKYKKIHKEFREMQDYIDDLACNND